jgi:hypothetical protein
MRGTRSCGIIVMGWLLVAQRWAGVNAWEEVTSRRKAFHTEAACRRYLAKQRNHPSGAQCISEHEFKRLPKSKTGDFEQFGAVPPDEATRRRLQALGYVDSK